VSLFRELRRRHVVRVAITYAVSAFVILQVAQLLAEGLDLPGFVFRVVTYVSLLGFPVALVLAWALDLTPEGIKRTKKATPGELAAADKRSSLATATLAVAAVLIMFAAGWWHLSTSPTTYDSIAVLPFVNLSPDSSGDYLGDGLAEELLNALGNISALKVAARTSAFSFKGGDVDVRSIGEQLGVVSVLEGSVRHDGNQVRVSAQLIDAGTGFSIWRGNYTRDTVDLFALQNEIASEIVNALAVEIGAANTERLSVGGTQNGDAYELYVRARQRWSNRTHDTDILQIALDEMRTAVKLDPDFALGWSGVSDVIDALAWRSSEFLPLVPEAKAAALRALALSPESPEAWASLGIITAEFDHEWALGEKLLEHAVALRPSYAQAHQWLADIQRYLGRPDQALASFAIVYQLDPLSNFFKQNYANQQVRFGNSADGEKMLREVVADWPDHENSIAVLAFSPLMSISTDERMEFAERWASVIGYSEPARARILVEAMTDESRRLEASTLLLDIYDECGWNERYAEIAASFNDSELTILLLQQGIEKDEVSIVGAGTNAHYALIADDPRFIALVENFNLPVAMP
jgi:adenylate cyclase